MTSAFPLPRKGRLFHMSRDFGINYPIHFIPACTLPVYALQYTLLCTTQDSVHDCWLDFIMVTISDYLLLMRFQGATQWTPCPLMQEHQPLRHYSQVWIWIPQSGIQWDFNPPDERVATHALQMSPPLYHTSLLSASPFCGLCFFDLHCHTGSHVAQWCLLYAHATFIPSAK